MGDYVYDIFKHFCEINMIIWLLLMPLDIVGKEEDAFKDSIFSLNTV